MCSVNLKGACQSSRVERKGYVPWLVVLRDDDHLLALTQSYRWNETHSQPCVLAVVQLFRLPHVAFAVVVLAVHDSKTQKFFYQHVNRRERVRNVLLAKEETKDELKVEFQVAPSCLAVLEHVLVNVDAAVLLMHEWTNNTAYSRMLASSNTSQCEGTDVGKS